MNINITHVALYTKDLEKSKAYYVKYFNGICNELYENKKGFMSYFITFKSGARLELMLDGYFGSCVADPDGNSVEITI